MGTPRSEPQREAQEIRHRVTIARPFYLGMHEVTQAEWMHVMGTNPSRFSHAAEDARSKTCRIRTCVSFSMR